MNANASYEYGLDLLVFAAHPDDAEIGMGGTIVKATGCGQKVGLIDLTYAEMSSNGDVETRQREAAAASALLGLTMRENLGLPDRGLTGSAEQIERITSAIRRHRPRVVFAPYTIDRHPDHVACGRMVEEAVFNAKLRRYRPDEPAWTLDMLFFYMINDVHPPLAVLDISDVHERKMEALRAYRSQFAPAGDQADWVHTPLTQGYLENVVARDRLFGQPKKFAYAEGFIPKGPLAIERF
ncbi:bacillithiol biosynthesis deacetylase BshB1 [Cohnella lubricantis]|uniref:Bacillithiol biosynthesis deacetylase BshB1 n=1 Tax=Cohnella lubricantis TaxID=2163172 RepID=A0A841TGU5_9BACL|nr:bacillithiol biosynthesis deacetylase BshB1 [Cohnella lubricantis]MBB6679606.1 bacillithiol biosynthesis deacetylase BshB1 [Cohnella lubricantis]MBP2119926.1 bacillithiol biosynthesis deacetylase BshB1 [Cohnella lubricantis]